MSRMQTVKERVRGAGGREQGRKRGPVPIFLLIALFCASCAPKNPQFVRTKKSFFYCLYVFHKATGMKTKDKKIIDLRQFVEDGLYNDFHVGGDKHIKLLNVWGKPFEFSSEGNEGTAAFNAWVEIAIYTGLALYPQYLLYPMTPSPVIYLLKLHGDLWNRYYDRSQRRFLILKDNLNYYDATNDAMVLTFLLLVNEREKNIVGYKKSEETISPVDLERKDIIKAYDALANLIDDNGHLACCMIDGKVYNEMYSRHGLVVASLVYAYKILGKELYAEKARKLADYFIAHNYHKEGYFDNWISIGTDSEICTGLLEVYDITGDKKYLNICEQVAKYYDNPHAKMTHDPQGHEDLRHDQHIYSTVDQAEFVILLKNLYAFTKNKKYLTMSRGILKDLEMCYDPKWKLYSHMCYWNGKHDDHFFAVIQAIIYIAML